MQLYSTDVRLIFHLEALLAGIVFCHSILDVGDGVPVAPQLHGARAAIGQGQRKHLEERKGCGPHCSSYPG